MAFSVLYEAYEALVVLMIMFIAVYSSCIGSVVFFILPEILPSIGLSITTFWSSIFNFVASYTYLYIQSSKIGTAGAFFIYAGIYFLATIYCFFRLPESKGKRLNETMKNLKAENQIPNIKLKSNTQNMIELTPTLDYEEANQKDEIESLNIKGLVQPEILVTDN